MLQLTHFKSIFATFVGGLLLLSPAQSHAEELELTFNHQTNKVETSVQLTSLVSFDLSIKFENAVGLTANNLAIDASLIQLDDPLLTQRLPDLLLTGVPSAFPVLISIEPAPDKGFSFSGAYEIELYTKSLHYTAGSPLRLFHSHADGTFEDMTTMTGSGSYRVRGNGGQFSDFIILADLRDIQTVINTKLARLKNFVTSASSSLSQAASTALVDAVNAIESALLTQNSGLALAKTEALIQLLESDNGTLYPDVWRSSGDLINIRGRTLGLAQTLRYSLRIQ